MADEKIEVEWIATANRMMQVLDKMDSRMVKQEVLLQKIGDTSKKSADLAAGSFAKLEQELKDNEAQLKKIPIGTKAFDDQKKKVDDLRKSLGQVKGELGNNAGAAVSGVVEKVGTMVAGFVSVQKIAEAVSFEFEKIKTMQLQAAATGRTVEQALADLGQNIGGDALPEARQMITEQAPKLGVTQEGLADLLGVAISAGAKDLQDAMSLVAASLKLTVGDATRARALVGGTLDVASLAGSKNYEGALGQMLQTQSQVRSTNLSEFTANIGPGLAAATADLSQQKGVTTERALEMASVISQIIKDPTGSNTATTMRMMFTRMGAFVPEREKKLDDGEVTKVSKDQIAAFQALNTFDERLKMMQEVPAIGAQFLETQRESIGKTAISEIINRSERAVAFEQKAAANIEGIDKAQAAFGSLVTAVERETPTLQADRRGKAALQTGDMAGVARLEGQSRELFESALMSVNLRGLDFIAEKAARIDAKLLGAEGKNTAQAFYEVLKTQQGMVSGGQTARDERILTGTLAELKKLSEAIDRLSNVQQQPIPVKVQAPAMRPKEVPLPAANVP